MAAEPTELPEEPVSEDITFLVHRLEDLRPRWRAELEAGLDALRGQIERG